VRNLSWPAVSHCIETYNLQLYLLAVDFDCLDLEINADRGQVSGSEVIFRETKQEACLTNS
jgi:hypothetical protein